MLCLCYRQLQLALADLSEASRLAPGSAEVRRLYARLQRDIAKENGGNSSVSAAAPFSSNEQQQFGSTTSLSDTASDCCLQPDVVKSAAVGDGGLQQEKRRTASSSSLASSGRPSGVRAGTAVHRQHLWSNSSVGGGDDVCSVSESLPEDVAEDSGYGYRFETNVDSNAISWQNSNAATCGRMLPNSRDGSGIQAHMRAVNNEYVQCLRNGQLVMPQTMSGNDGESHLLRRATNERRSFREETTV